VVTTPHGDMGTFHRLAAMSLLLVGVVGCATAAPSLPERHTLGERDFIQQLAPGVWRHVTYQDLPRWGPFPANGLIARTSDGKALVVDATWSDVQAKRVLQWSERNVGPVVGLVITHAHNDRDGGRKVFEAHGIPRVSRGDLKPFGLEGEVFFPGHGHAPDNVVVWLRDARVLFGGCMVRAAGTRNLGNTADADIASWHQAVKELLQRFPKATVVVPGHGAPGGRELLVHTATLSQPGR